MRPIALATMALCLGALNAEAATLRAMTTLHTSIVRLSDLFENAGGNGVDRVLGPTRRRRPHRGGGGAAWRDCPPVRR